MSYYKINSSFNGNPFSIRYYPDGEGRHYEGYVTNFRQLKDALYRHFSVRGLHLSTVADGQHQPIASDAQLRRAVEHLRNHGVLLLNIYTAAMLAGEQAGSSRRRSRSSISVESPTDIKTSWNTSAAHTTIPEPKTVLSHFAVHYADCHHCRCAPITGARYVHKTHTAYSLCSACYSALRRSEKRDLVRKILPWDSDAPRAPLHLDDSVRREDTRHLQYLLTRIGFLKLSATSNVQGVYCARTAAAVEKFRRKYRITGGDVRVYDQNTARVLAEAVRHLRAEGTKYL